MNGEWFYLICLAFSSIPLYLVPWTIHSRCNKCLSFWKRKGLSLKYHIFLGKVSHIESLSLYVCLINLSLFSILICPLIFTSSFSIIGINCVLFCPGSREHLCISLYEFGLHVYLYSFFHLWIVSCDDKWLFRLRCQPI